MTIIPTENRATMAAYREGRTQDEFLDDMWKRRAAEWPERINSVAPAAKWPMSMEAVLALPPLTEPKPAENVTTIPRKKVGNG